MVDQIYYGHSFKEKKGKCRKKCQEGLTRFLNWYMDLSLVQLLGIEYSIFSGSDPSGLKIQMDGICTISK
jgi:hypothetical protein